MTFEELRRCSDAPVVIADQEGLIIEVNKPFQAVFGWSAEEIVGKPLTVIIPKSLHDSHHLGFARFLATGKPTLLDQPLRLKAVTKDGGEFDAEHFIVAQQAGGRWQFGATIRPLEGQGRAASG